MSGSPGHLRTAPPLLNRLGGALGAAAVIIALAATAAQAPMAAAQTPPAAVSTCVEVGNLINSAWKIVTNNCSVDIKVIGRGGGTAQVRTYNSTVTPNNTLTVYKSADTCFQYANAAMQSNSGYKACPTDTSVANYPNAHQSISGSPFINAAGKAVGIKFNQTAVSVAQDGTQTFTVKLLGEPSANVTLTVAQPTSNTGVTVDTEASSPSTNETTLTFTSSNWYTPKTVTVAAADDATVQNSAATLSWTASGASEYASVTGSVTVNVSPSGQINVTPASLTLNEGGNTGELSVTLEAAPTSSVTVNLENNHSNVTLSPSTLTFTSGNWSTAQKVTVTVADDGVDGQNARQADDTITISASAGIAAPNVTRTLSINPKTKLVIASSPVTVREGAGQAKSFSVKLSASPKENTLVRVSISYDNRDAVSVSPAQLTFTDTNWDTINSVRITSKEDDDADNETVTVTLIATASAGAGLYFPTPSETKEISVIDNDTGFVLTPTSLSMDEGGNGTFQVKLNKAPSAAVTVSLASSNTEVSVSPNMLNFTTSNWGTNQPVTVTSTADADNTDDTANITLTGTGLAAKTLTVTVKDPIPLILTPPNLNVIKGMTAAFKVKLAKQPSASTTVNLASDSNDLSVSPAMMTFSTSNWGSDQTVTITAGASPTDTSATVTASGTGVKSGSVGVSIFQAAPPDGRIGFGRYNTAHSISVYADEFKSDVVTKEFNVRLKAQPNRDVTISMRNTNPDVTFSPTELTFTSDNYSNDQKVTVTITEDDDADYDTDTITLWATGGINANDVTIPVSISDPDDATVGFEIEGNPSSLVITEGTVLPIKVRLKVKPTVSTLSARMGVTITPNSVNVDNDDSHSFKASSFSFSSTEGQTNSWNEFKTMYVIADETTRHTADSMGIIEINSNGRDRNGNGNYHLVRLQIPITVIDNDTFTVSTTSLNVDKGQSSTFKIKLTSNPAEASVTVTLSSDNTDVKIDTDPDTQGDQNTLTFTGNVGMVDGNWNEYQTVTVTAAADPSNTSAKITASGTNLKSAEVAVTVITPLRLTLDPTSLTMNEGESETFDVKLSAQPDANVTVTLSSNNSEVTISDTDPDTQGTQSTLTFTTTNWEDEQTVTVTSTADADYVDDTADITLSSTGGLPNSTLTVTVKDPIPLTLSATTLDVGKGQSSKFNVKLAAQPAASVTVNLASDNTDVTVSPATLTFSTTNGTTDQEVTVSADASADLDDTATITASGTDVKSATVAVTVVQPTYELEIENSPSSLKLTHGVSQTIKVKLKSQPNRDITATMAGLTSSNPAEFSLTPSPNPLTFTSANWSTYQEVVLTGTNTSSSDTVPTFSTYFSGSGLSNGGSSGLGISIEVLKAIGLDLAPTALTVNEGSNTDTFTVKLDSRPANNNQRTVNLTSSDTAKVTVSPTSLTFSHSNYNTAKTVTVTSIEDSDKDNHSATISLSGDGVAAETLVVTVEDGIVLTLSKTSLAMFEGGSDTFTVQLAEQPSSTQTITLSSDNTDVTVSPTSLTFTQSGSTIWSTAQTVTVMGAADSDSNNDSAKITLSGSGASTIRAAAVDVTVNEPIGLTLDSNSISMNEGGTATFTVKLSAQPDASVTVNLASDNTDVTLDKTSLTFTPSGSNIWSTAQTVTVTGGTDTDKADDTATITLAATGITSDTVSVEVLDTIEATRSITDDIDADEGTSATFTYVLASKPLSDRTITLRTDDASLTIATGGGTPSRDLTLTFSQSGSNIWSTAQTVTLTAASDNNMVDQLSGITVTLGDNLAHPSGTNKDIVVRMRDPDIGLEVEDVPLNLLEATSGNVTGTFRVKLSDQPYADSAMARTVTLSSNNTDVTINDTDSGTGGTQQTLTFNNSNWNTYQTVTITAAADADADDDTATITISGDAVTSATAAVNVFERIAATRSETSSMIVDEGPDDSTFTYVLASQPSGNRTITLNTTYADLTLATGTGAFSQSLTLTFTEDNWNVAQTVKVKAAEDNDKNDRSEDINVSLGDGLTGDGDLAVLMRDNDMGIVITDAPTTLTEGASGMFKVKLDGEPDDDTSANRTLSLSSTNADITLSPTTLTFTNSGGTAWNIDQDVTYSVAADADGSDDTAKIEITGDAVIDEELSVTIYEGVLAVRDPADSISVDEGTSTTTFSYVLESQPSSDRTITASSSDTDVTLSTGAGAASQRVTLTFTSATWQTAQTIALHIAGDADDDDKRTTISFDLSDGLVHKSGIEDDLSVHVRDDEMTLSLSDTSMTLLEGGSDTFEVSISGDLPADVERVVTLASDNNDITVSPTSLTFTSTAQSAKTVTVRGAADTDVADDSATITVGGGGFDDVTATVRVLEAIGAERSENMLIADEGTSTASFTYVLTSQPASDRNIEIATSHADLTVASGGVAASQSLTLTFTEDNWEDAQTVNVSVAEDSDKDDREAEITFTLGEGLAHTADSNEKLTVQMRDNDMGFVITDAPGNLTEGGASAMFKVKLDGEPITTRDVTVASTNVNISISPTTLSFAKDQGDVNKDVTIAATADDDAVDGSATINLSGTGLRDGSATVTVLEAIEAVRDPVDSITVDEGTSTSTFSYVLESQPANTRSITATSPNADITLSTGGGAASQSITLNFTSATWLTPQEVKLHIADDADDDDERIDISFDLGDGLVHKSGVEDDLSVHVRDDDMTLTLSSATLTLPEGGSETFTVSLSGELPANAERTVALASDNNDITVSPTSLTFTSANQSGETVTVSGTADSDAADDSAAITVSGDGFDDVTAAVSVLEDIKATRTPASLVIADEGTSSSTFTYVLDSRPTGNRTVALSSGNSGITLAAGGGSSSQNLSLTFTPANWDTAQAVTISAAEDSDEDDLLAEIDIALGVGLSHNRGTRSKLDVLSHDNDMELELSSAQLAMTENSTETLTVKVSGQPTHGRSRAITLASDNNDVTLDPTSLTFTDINWSTGQTVTVSAAGDDSSDDESATITLSVSDGTPLDDATVSVTVEEDIALYRSENLITVDEGDAAGATFDLRLTSQPGTDRIVTMAASDADALTFSPPSVTFTSDNWQTDQTITVVAADDDDTETEDVSISFEGVGFTANPITARVRDDDVGLTLSLDSLIVMEGDGGTFTVKLAGQPPQKDGRTVSVASDNGGITVSPLELIFTGGDDGNWNDPQTVTISTTADSDAVDAVATIEFTGAGIATESLSVTAAETVGLTLTDAPLNVTEGGSGMFKVKLAAEIAGSRTVSLASDSADITVSPNPLRFDSANWSVEQTVTVNAATDSDLIDNSVTIDLTGTGLTAASAAVTALERIEAYRDSNTLIADEGTSTSTFQYVLETRPSGSRRIELATSHADLTIAADGGTASRSLTLTFTPANWDTAQVITVAAAQDDDAADRDAYVDITLGAGLAHKSGVTDRLAVTLRDDDVGLTLTPAALIVNEGISGTFTVRLASQPAQKDSRTVTLTSSDDDVTVTPDSLTFNGGDGGNWKAAQTVTVETVQDSDSVNNSATIDLSGDGIVTGTLNVTVFETSDLILSDAGLTIEENGSGEFSVELSTQPNGNRTIDLSSDNRDVTFRPASLTFTSDNWDTAQNVTVRATQDADTTNDTARIGLSGAGITTVSLNVTVTEGIPLIRSLETITVDEGDAEGSTFSIRLASQPSADKRVSVLSTHPDLTVSPASVTFTPANWQTPVAVTLTAGEDSDAADRAVFISFDSPGVAADYITATIRDDEMGLSLSDALLTIDELGSGSFTVQLSDSALTPRTVNLTSDNPDVTLDPASLTFTSENWNSPATVSVTAGADPDTINDSAQIDIDGVSVQSDALAVTVIDGTSAGLTLSQSSLSIDEGGTRSFTVRLASQPNSARTVNLTSTATNISFTPTSLTFSGGADGDWGTAQGVSVSAFQDDDTVNNSAIIALAGDEIAAASLSVTVIDNDPVALSLSESALRVDEASSSTFTVQLASEPNGPRMIRLTSDNTDLTVTPPSLTFTAGNWNAPQTVRVGAISDTDTTDDISSISFAGEMVTSATLPVTVADDDSVKLILSKSSLAIDEEGTDAFTVVLASQPNTDSTVNLSSTNVDVVLDKGALDFTTSNWDTPQTVTVTARADDDTTNDPATIRLSGIDISPLFLPVTVTDNDPIALTLSRTSLNLEETGTATFTVRPASEPNGDRTVNLSSDDSDVMFDPDSLTFTTANWEDPQTVTLTSRSDTDSVNDLVTISFSGTLVTSTSLAVTVIDNDDVGLTLSESSLNIDEESSGTFSFRLTSVVSTDRMVTLAGSEGSDLTVSPTSLTFTAADWNKSQTVTVSAAHDDDTDNDQSTIELGGTGIASTSLAVTVIDNDPNTLVLSVPSLTIDEAQTGTFTVRLGSRPNGNRTVGLTSDHADVTVSPASLNFTSGNWDTPREITVSTVMDDDPANTLAEISLSGTLLIAGTLAVTVADDDPVELVVSETSLTLDESSSTTFSVQLASDVGVDRTVDLASSLSGVTLTPTSLTFATGSQTDPQTVTVTAAADDNTVNESGSITLSGTLITEAAVPVTVTDTDSVELVVSRADLAVDEGESDTFTVRLAAAVSATRNITLTSSRKNVTVSPATLEFTSENWETPQTVTVTSVSDSDRRDDAATITLSGADVAPASLVMEVTDDDLGLTLSVSRLEIPEGTEETFTVQLNTQPRTARSMTLAASNTIDSQPSPVTVSPAQLNFTSENWDAPQTVTITALQDGNAASDLATVTFTGDNVKARPLSVRVIDDANIGLTLAGAPVEVTEGRTATFTIQLAAQPITPKSVTLASDSRDVTFSPASLDFSIINWSTPQTVTVRADQDGDALNETATLTLEGTGITTTPVTVNITDDDPVGLIVSENTIALREGRSLTLSVELDRATSIERTVELEFEAALTNVTLDPQQLVFTAEEWNVPQTVTITALHDENTSDETGLLMLKGSGVFLLTLTISIDDDDDGAFPEEETEAASLLLAEVAGTVLPAASNTIHLRVNAARDERSATVAGQQIALDRSLANDIAAGFASRAGVQDAASQSRFAQDRFGAERQSVNWLGGVPLEDGRPVRGAENRSSISLGRDALLSSFSYAFSPTDGRPGGGWSVWGRVETSEFSGLNEAVEFDGSQNNIWLGFDRRSESGSLTGMALSLSSSDADYTLGRFGASIQTDLSLVLPYLEISSESGSSGLVMIGLGNGQATLTQTNKVEGVADLQMHLMSIGGDWPAARFKNSTLSWSSELGFTRLQTVESELPTLADLSIDNAQFRGGLELSHNGFGDFTKVSPRIGLMLRHDAGDGITGTGFELTAGLQINSPLNRFSLDINLRSLASHSAEELSDWGASLQFRINSRPDGSGLGLSVGPHWGAADTGLLNREDAFQLSDADLQRREDQQNNRGLAANLAYGLRSFGGLLTPYSEFNFTSGASGSTRQITGVRFNSSDTLELRLFSERQISSQGAVRSRVAAEIEKQY
ncbi:MAG: hypothetical protein ISN29_08215 [Gammaproteobacteria bacterium AqS3]|nr:hypothetical protein [Gammaproteobacteria bacterium AqS3]